MLKERSRDVLRAVVLDYMRTIAPVSSRQITEGYDLGVSPATVRNVLAELETREFLEQPHTSAGRVPTDKALRYYVDHLMEERGVAPEDRAEMERAVFATHGIADLARGAGRALSVASHYAGVASAPSGAAAVCERVEFVRLAEGRMLALFLMHSRVLYSGVVESEEDYSQEQLERFARQLNPILSGLSLHALRDRILREMEHERARFDKALAAALRLGAGALAGHGAGGAEVFVEGSAHVLGQPEFTDVAALRDLARAFEERSRLLSLLGAAMESAGVRIFIGSEAEYEELRGCALVLAGYGRGARPLGTVGVIGPKRMDYSRVVALVDCAARTLSRAMERG